MKRAQLATIRVAVLALLCVVYPIASYAFPAMGRAWGMYASTSMYRLQITGVGVDGSRAPISSDAVIADASPRVAAALSLAEHGRHGSVLSLPSQLVRVAEHACRPDLREVQIDLEWSPTDGADHRTEHAAVTCPE